MTACRTSAAHTARSGEAAKNAVAAALSPRDAKSPKDERELSKVIGRYGRIDLLCLDELGYLHLDRRGAELLFQVLTERDERASIAVASNAYDEGLGQFFSRSALDKGKLTLYVLRHLTPGDVIRLSITMLLGNWQHDDALSIESVDAVTITTRKELLKVMFDGEVETLRTPLEFSIRAKALSVIVQPSAAEVVQ